MGGSRDDVATLERFAAAEHVPFAFVALPSATVDAYGAAIVYAGATYADRVSYLIGRDGTILWTLRDPSPLAHTNGAVAFLKRLRSERKNR